MILDGKEYKSFDEVAELFQATKQTIKRRCDRFKIDYLAFGKVRYLADSSISTLLEKNTEYENAREKKAKTYADAYKKKKAGTTTTKKP